MKISLPWLKQYVDPRASTRQIADRLTMTLNEVDEAYELTGLDNILVGEIREITAHPDADNVRVTAVRVGRKDYQILCGAANIAVGQKVAVALPGVTLPSGLAIEVRKIRGVASHGMLCSARELGIGEDHQGILVLAADAVSGVPLSEALGDAHDWFELEVLANRPDCMGYLGIAREVAAAFQVPLREPTLLTPDRQIAGPYEVQLPDGGCTRYGLAYLTGVTDGPSPAWLRDRLTAAGIRPVSAVVDVTNYVMLETAQPLHAMDAAHFDKKIIVRPATKDEPVTTLDGTTRRVPKNTLLITDGQQTLGVAGIMGGQRSQVSAGTTDVVLESAHFAAERIRRASRLLGLRTDASARFERGISEQLTSSALRRAVDLITEICGGTLAQLTDTHVTHEKPAKVTLDTAYLREFLGIAIPDDEMKNILTSLGFKMEPSAAGYRVTPPIWRSDVTLPVDLAEEVARIHGYDALPATLPVAHLTVPTRPSAYALAGRLRHILTAGGVTEILTHSLVGPRLRNKAGTSTDEEQVTLANPLSEDHLSLRSDLTTRHLEAVAANLRWRPELRLYEIGTVIELGPSPTAQPKESARLLVTFATKQPADLFPEIRGVLDLLMRRLHLGPSTFTFLDIPQDSFKDGRSFAIDADDIYLGYLSEYRHPERFKAQHIYLLELDVARLETVLPTSWNVEPLAAFPPVMRDISVFMPAGASYGDVAGLIKRHGPETLWRVGEPSEYARDGRRSLTVRLEFRSDRQTLTDHAVNESLEPIAQALRQAGYEIRD